MRSITMSRVLLSGALALGALGAIGGFTPGVATADAAPNTSPFAGSWSGSWSHTEDDDVGTADWTISNGGRISGTVYNITGASGGAVVGHVGSDGNLVIIASVPNDDVPASVSGYPHQGTAEIDGDGRLVVSATGTGAGAVSFVAIFKRN